MYFYEYYEVIKLVIFMIALNMKAGSAKHLLHCPNCKNVRHSMSVKWGSVWMFMLYAQAIVALLDHGVPGVEFWLHVAHLRFTVNQNAFEFTSESNLALIRLYKGGGSTWKTTIPGQIIWIHAFNALIFFPFAKKWPKISFPSHILHLQMIFHFYLKLV